jgi:predicted small secreted protein
VRIAVLLLALCCVSCNTVKLKGEHLADKAKACIAAGMEIQVEEDYNNHAELFCVPVAK